MKTSTRHLANCSREVLRRNFRREALKLFDSHAHYYDEWFGDEADTVLKEEVFGKNVARVVNVGTNNKNNLICIESTRRYEGMYAAVGIHPEDVRYIDGAPEGEVALLEKIILDEKQRDDCKIVAIGEIGYDFHYEGYDKDKQERYFEFQMQLAQRLSMPVVIHDREAHGPCFDMVLKYPNVKGIFHSYSGSAEMARELVKRGWYISFSGVLTFKNAARVREVAASVPLDRILIETDAPYLAPHPFRGKRNHSGLMEYTAISLAEVKGITPDEAAEITYNNACTIFGIE